MPEPEVAELGEAKGTGKGRGIWGVLKKRWRGWLRAIHRDFGYLAVGFTLIYALSGLAINHIADWDPNFKSYARERHIDPIPAGLSDDEAIARVEKVLAVGRPRDALRAGDEIHLDYDNRNIVVYGDTGLVVDQGRSSRFFFRVANWLHYNRGKKAWTYVADVYAVMLLYLAISGIFMIKGRLGLRWRGAILVSLGVAAPLTYVLVSGGPEQKSSAAPAIARPGATDPGAEPDEPGEEPGALQPRMQPRAIQPR